VSEATTLVSRAGRQSRPGRAVVVAPDLDLLRGPTSGVVELLHRLFWQADRHVDLDKPALLAWLYETVLQEAVSIDELHDWLDRDKLAELWAEIFLPRDVRAAWEHRHPQLRGLGSVAGFAPAVPGTLAA